MRHYSNLELIIIHSLVDEIRKSKGQPRLQALTKLKRFDRSLALRLEAEILQHQKQRGAYRRR